MNKFFETAIGKSTQTFLWTLASYTIVIGMADLSQVHWSSKLIVLGAPGLVNWTLYTAKVLIDKEVPNLPSSTRMELVPVTTPADSPMQA